MIGRQGGVDDADGAGLHGACAQVAERSLFMWNNEYIVSMVAQQRAAVLPLIYAALERNEREHWNPQVLGLTGNVRKMFRDMDEGLYEECRLRYEADQARALSRLPHPVSAQLSCCVLSHSSITLLAPAAAVEC